MAGKTVAYCFVMMAVCSRGFLLAGALLGLLGAGLATQGVDISQATYEDAFQCLKSNGYTFAIIRAYESIGQPDSNACGSCHFAFLDCQPQDFTLF